MQVRDSRRLCFVYEIRVPHRSSSRLSKIRFPAFLDLQIRPNRSHTRNFRYLRSLGMDFDKPKIFAELLLLLGRNILVQEKDNAALGNE